MRPPIYFAPLITDADAVCCSPCPIAWQVVELVVQIIAGLFREQAAALRCSRTTSWKFGPCRFATFSSEAPWKEDTAESQVRTTGYDLR